MLAKEYRRHPDVGDHVSLGANSRVTDDVPDDTGTFVAHHPEQTRNSNR